ncbi:MAG: ComEC/Rec2 family competence protein, partial [bacterium]
MSNSGRPSFQLRLDRIVDITGWVSRTPEVRDDSVYFELKPSRVIQAGQIVPYSERISVWVSSSQDQPEDFFEPPLQYGELLKTMAYLREPAFYAVPGVEDHRRLAWLQGTPFRLQLKSPLQLERLGRRNWIGTLTAPFFHYLRWFETNARKVLGDQAFSFLLGVFLGRKRSLDEPEKELIRNLGLLHLFVVSGFHISLLVFFLHSAFRAMGRFGLLVTIVAIWVYILAIGFPLAAIRAGIIASVAYLMISNRLQRNLLNGVGISALTISCVAPRSVFAASFHLSYICLCAIGLLALPSMKYIRAIQLGIEDLWISSLSLGREQHLILRRSLRFYLESVLRFTPHDRILFLKKPLAYTISYLLMLLLCSVCIQLLLFPVALHYTNRWSLTQWLSNLLLVPMFSLLVALCFLFFLLFWTPLGSLIAWSLDQWTDFCHILILSLGSVSPVTFLPHPRFWEICTCLIVTLLAALTLPGRAKALAL